MTKTDILIVGGGAAGLTAALYAARAGNDVIVIENSVHGGQIINTFEVENYPAIAKISGVDFANSLLSQATAFGAQIVYEQPEDMDFTKPEKWIKTNGGEYCAKAVILANGVVKRKLDVPGEERLTGRGVSYCATCDGNFFKDKVTAVVGGGNTALEDALFLANLCKKVYIIHRRDSFRGDQYNINALLRQENVEPLMETVVQRIHGEKTLERLELRSVKSGAVRDLEVEGLFVAVGLAPQNELFRPCIDLTDDGFVVAGEDTKTNLPGVFAAGDTRRKPLRQLVTAAADGAVAAVAASSYILSQEGI